MKALPAIAVFDRETDDLAVISHGSWADMFQALYDSVSSFYRDFADHAFLVLAQRIDDIDQELADLDGAHGRIIQDVERLWPSSVTLTLDWVYHHSSDREHFVARCTELLSGLDVGGDQNDAPRRLTDYWLLRRIHTELGNIYRVLRTAQGLRR